MFGIFNVRTDVMRVIVHGGCTGTVRESALKADSGIEIPCRNGDSTRRQYCSWLFSRTLYQVSYTRSLRGSIWSCCSFLGPLGRLGLSYFCPSPVSVGRFGPSHSCPRPTECWKIGFISFLPLSVECWKIGVIPFLPRSVLAKAH